jgi:hypothetical protein
MRLDAMSLARYYNRNSHPGGIKSMTTKQARAVLKGISYPGVRFKMGPVLAGKVHIDLDADVVDTRDHCTLITIRRRFEVYLTFVTTTEMLTVIVFREIVGFLAHEAAERFRVNGSLVFDPHIHGDPDVSVEVDYSELSA